MKKSLIVIALIALTSCAHHHCCKNQEQCKMKSEQCKMKSEAGKENAQKSSDSSAVTVPKKE